LTNFWWVRHGPTHATVMAGWSDIAADLSDTAALERLSDYLPATALVISSDLVRCTATADAIAGARQRLPADPGLRELNFGDWEMRNWADIDAEDPEAIRAYWSNPGDSRPPNGESWNEAAARVSAAADRLLAKHAGADLVVVAHFGAILTQLQRALQLPLAEVFSHKIGNLSVTRLSFDQHWIAHEINHNP
jgi:alpha-ribazole phosphatase